MSMRVAAAGAIVDRSVATPSLPSWEATAAPRGPAADPEQGGDRIWHWVAGRVIRDGAGYHVRAGSGASGRPIGTPNREAQTP